MKVCRKCKREYKDDYIYCPKCGTPYDEKMKPVKIPGDISGGFNIVKKIWTGFLYGFGGLLILAYLSSFKEDVISSIFAILFGLSLFKIFYTMIEDKFTNLDEKYIKIARILIPIGLFILWIICAPVENIEDKNDNLPQNNIEQKENIDKDVINTENTDNKENNKNDDSTNIEVEETVYHLQYNELGEFGKYVEYENKNSIFYYFPDGQYKIEVTNLNDNFCFLWIDYREGYQNGNHGTAYNNKEKLTFTSTQKTNSVTLDSSVHIYNSNDCDYKFTLVK